MKVSKTIVETTITIILSAMGLWFLLMAFDVKDSTGMALFFIFGLLCLIIPVFNYIIKAGQKDHYMNLRSDLEHAKREYNEEDRSQ